MLLNILRAMRPKQWTKNAILFFPLAFTLNEYWTPFSPEMYRFVGLATAGLRRLLPALRRRLHHQRCRRRREGPPAPHEAQPPHRLRQASASGRRWSPRQRSPSSAWPPALPSASRFGVVAAAYFVLQLGLHLRAQAHGPDRRLHLAAGFVLRAVAGAVVIQVAISPWLYLVHRPALALPGLLQAPPRADPAQRSGRQPSPDPARIHTELLEEILSVVTSTTVMAYSLYTFTYEKLPKNHAMMLTIPFVLYGIFRYLYLVHLKNDGRQPGGDPARRSPLPDQHHRSGWSASSPSSTSSASAADSRIARIAHKGRPGSVSPFCVRILALCVLLGLAGTAQTGLLAFLLAGIAGQEAILAQHLAQASHRTPPGHAPGHG